MAILRSVSAPVIVAAAVIVREGRVLLTQRRPGTHLAGAWEFPGGKVEPAEAPEDALVRECREECGIEVLPTDILDVTFHRYPGKDVLLLFYRADIAAGEVRHIGVADHVWCSADDIDEYELPPADVRIIEKVRRLLG